MTLRLRSGQAEEMVDLRSLVRRRSAAGDVALAAERLELEVGVNADVILTHHWR